MNAEPRLLLRQVRSENGRSWQQRLVLRGLGLRGCGSQVTVANERAIRGMIRKVLHLIEVSSVDGNSVDAKSVDGNAVSPAPVAKTAASAAKRSKS